MNISELAGKPAPASILANIPRLVSAYFANTPDPATPACRVAFGTSGHRGTSFKNSFNELHIAAICQAICEYRKAAKINGPLFVGMDTHALSEAALVTAIEVFAAQRVTVKVQQELRYTPTPVISHAILTYNRGRKKGLADGVVITPSHNPPQDGGFKYNPPHGGPADTAVTKVIEDRANSIAASGLRKIKRVSFEKALQSSWVCPYDYVAPYVNDLENVLDMKSIAAANLKIGVDPMGGATIDFWDPIADRYGLSLDVVNRRVDPTFSFMTCDKDGKIRMDCSSAYAMAGLIGLKDRFDIAFGNDTDGDRHGIVTKSGLMAPNAFLAAAVSYLFGHRPGWRKDAAIGKTLVSTSMIDRVATSLGRPLAEVPVGFKWFVPGLIDGSCGFGGEESAGASFLRHDGSVWTTDKDGILLDLLACEMLAKTGKDPDCLYSELVDRFGQPFYIRMDMPATAAQKAAFKTFQPQALTTTQLASEPITAVLTRAPANGADIGGTKVVTENGWFAARPSGTEDIYKIYAESFRSEEHLSQILREATGIVEEIFQSGKTLNE